MDLEQWLENRQTGTVVRWVQENNRRAYTYAAIKISNGAWYTTATTENPYVEHQMLSKTFSALLRQPNVSDVSASAGWVDF